MIDERACGPVDGQVLSRLLDDTAPAAFRELLAECRLELPGRVAAAGRAAAAGDATALGHSAHSVKGIAATFGLTVIVDMAKAIEAACAEGKLDRARRLTTTMSESLPATLIALARAAEALRNRGS